MLPWLQVFSSATAAWSIVPAGGTNTSAYHIVLNGRSKGGKPCPLAYLGADASCPNPTPKAGCGLRLFNGPKNNGALMLWDLPPVR